jgi:hypothetical protein
MFVSSHFRCQAKDNGMKWNGKDLMKQRSRQSSSELKSESTSWAKQKKKKKKTFNFIWSSFASQSCDDDDYLLSL